MHRSIRRAIGAVSLAAAMLAVAGNSALAAPGDGGPEPTEVICTKQISGTLNASPTMVNSGGSTTLTWNVSMPAFCAGEVTFRLGTSTSSPAVAKSGSKVFKPVIGTTYRLYADWGNHVTTLASRYVGIIGETPITMQLTTFRAVDAQEEGGVANGDEPWLMVFPVYADGRTVDFANLSSSSVFVSGPLLAHENLGRTGVYDGHQFAVPASTGTFTRTVQPVRNLPLVVGKQAAMVGMIVVALEEDGTPDSAALAARAAARTELGSQLTNLIRNIDILNPVPTDAQIEEIQEAVRDKVIDTVTWETLASFGLAGVFDPDDYIGADFVLHSQADIEAAGAGGLPFTFNFENDGAHYRISGVVRNG